MTKRKRHDTPPEIDSDGGAPAGNAVRIHRVEHKLDQGRKLLFRAFKTARGFERQKLGRRRKTALSSDTPTDVSRIDAETTALKTLDLSAVAANHLHKSLLKVKAVAQSSDLPQSIHTPPSHAQDAATLNVVARLCNSNPVKTALPPVLRDVHSALGIKDDHRGSLASGTQPNRSHKAKVQPPVADADSGGSSDDAVDSRKHAPASSLDSGRIPPVSDDEEEDSFEGFDSRLAGSSSDEEDMDDLEADEEKRQLQEPRKGARRLKPDISLSPSPSVSRSPSPVAAQRPKPTKSSFIPSLTMGGYWSGSESEPEDIEDTTNKKNRRGQRARQALAEKKFGNSAKHLQKDGAGKNGRDSGWDAKRGAVAGRGDRVRPDRRGQTGRSVPPTKNDAPAPKHRDDEGALHPSWAAAKKAKEAKAAAPFQGKKIVFD